MKETKQIIKQTSLKELKKDFYNNSFKKYNCKSPRTFVEVLKDLNLLHKIQKPLTNKQRKALDKIPNALDILK